MRDLEWEQPERCPYEHGQDSEENEPVMKTGIYSLPNVNLEIWLCGAGHEFFVESL